MGLTSLPVRGSGQPLGPTKSDARTATDLTRELASAEWNAAAKAIEEVCAEVGLGSGATVGSIVYLLKNLGGVALPGVVAAGTYTPSATSVANLDVTPSTFLTEYAQVGSIVAVAGSVTVDPTAAGSFAFRLSLPVPSNFTGGTRASGIFGGSSIFSAGNISADATNDQLYLQGSASATTSSSAYFIALYNVQ